MAATLQAMLGRLQGTSWATALANNVQALDMIQIVDHSGNILVNVDQNGVVNKPASSPTNGTHYGPYYTRLTSSASLAAIFADAFSDFDNSDILQLISPTGGSILKWIDNQGVSH